MNETIAVVISGQVSAGKTTAAKMLRANHGFDYARISYAIKKRWTGDPNEKPTRSWYQEMGMQLHRTIGQRALCEETLDFIEDLTKPFVIDGARWNEDIAYFRERFGSRLIHIHLMANRDVRRERFESREKDVSFEEADGHVVEQEIPELGKIADKLFDNSADDIDRLEAFLRSVVASDSHAR